MSATRSDRKIQALYADGYNHDAQVYVDGGFTWMILRGDDAAATTNMLVIAAEAKSDDRFVVFVEDPPGTISRLYVV